MKIAVLGGGFAGLSAAYYLSKTGHEVTIFEREPLLGGLAVGFKQPGWEWPLERAYHHLFATDSAIRGLAKETGFDGIYFKSPETASLYKVNNNYRIFPVDSPQNLLKFPLLPFIDKIRTGLFLVFLKLSPPLAIYDQKTAKDLSVALMGERAWDVLTGELMRKKFGKYAGNILAAFVWARVKVRTKSLGYIRGGFQTFVEHLEKTNSDLGVIIKKGSEISKIEKSKGYKLTYKNIGGVSHADTFDAVISTLPSPILAKLVGKLFPASYFEKFRKLQYLNAVVLILESKEPLLNKTYWLNICDPEIPLMFVGQHTNFVDKKHYGGSHLAYVGWYVDPQDKLWTMNDKDILAFITPHIKKISPKFEMNKVKTYLFKAPFAQPVFNKTFVKNKPDFKTPLENFYIANLDMTYPNDRGTNYAVALGRKVSELINIRG